MLFDFPLEEMIQQQLVSRGIDDQRVIEAFRTYDRALFVPPYLLNRAYEDERPPIGVGQTLSPPYINARMIQELKLPKDASVLEVGTGSGYLTSLLSKMASQVYSLEILPELSARARRVLADDLGIDNVVFRPADGFQGWSDEAPYDAIVVNCSVAEAVPWPLEGQLRVGRRLAIAIGEREQRLTVWERTSMTGDLELVYEEPINLPFGMMEGEATEE
jgi:protein-L-isoaspartate(D-aspartate) O-methyltransferase